MSIRTTVTLDDDVAAYVKRESQTRGMSFHDTINEPLSVPLALSVYEERLDVVVIQPGL